MKDFGANVDLLLNGKAQGDVARQIISNARMDAGMFKPFIDDRTGRAYVTVYKGGDPKSPQSYATVPVNNATLRRDEWKTLDEAVLKIAEARLGGIQDLVSRGLVYDIGNGMGSTVLEYHDVSDALEAEMTMDGVNRSKGDRPAYGTHYLPLPIIHADYEINERVLQASRKLGQPLDTTMAERAAKKVQEKLERMLFQDETYSFGGGTIYSYLNHPSRNQITLSDYGSWTDSSTSASAIIELVLAMKQASINDHFYGPWMLYIPTSYETVLDQDYDSTTPGTTIRERIKKINGILDVKVIDYLYNSEDSSSSENVLLVQMTNDVVRLVRGMGIQNVEWSTEGKLIHKYKVMTIQVPQIRADYNGRCGVVHAA